MVDGRGLSGPGNSYRLEGPTRQTNYDTLYFGCFHVRMERMFVWEHFRVTESIHPPMEIRPPIEITAPTPFRDPLKG